MLLNLSSEESEDNEGAGASGHQCSAIPKDNNLGKVLS